MKLKLKNKFEELPGIWTFQFTSEPQLDWQPGQYLQYHIDNPAPDDRKVERYFTIASTPQESHIQLTTRIDSQKSSTFKKDLLNLKIAQVIDATGPYGSFTLTDSLNHVFIAGGIGITPFRAILVDLQKSNKPINITLIYANRDKNIVFKDELVKIAQTNPNLKIHFLVDPEKITPQVIEQATASSNPASYYISGPEPMVNAIKELLITMQVAEDKIKLDSFSGYQKI